jgi:alkaline phosphatase D
MLPSRRPFLISLASAGLAAPAFLRHARAADVPRFDLGVASGHVQADTLVLWTRLTGLDLPAQVPVRWQLAHDEAFTQIAAQGSELAEAGSTHCVHAEPGGLQPARWYWYRFEALGLQSATGRTRTAPAADAPATLRTAITSCQRWDHGHWAAWAHLAQRDLDLVMFLGDYIYEYGSPPSALRQHDGPMVRTLDQYRSRYAQYKSDPALQAAHAAAPWLVVWDDHEVENDYANDRGQSRQGPDFLRQRAAAYQAWWEHQPVPKAMRPVGPDARIHHRLDWGRLARIHALDARQYRDHQVCLPLLRSGGSSTVNAADCPALQDVQRSLLGHAQERWLNEGWDTQRPWNLLAQQTLMARASRQAVASPGTGPDTGRDTGRYWTDGWDGYAPARQRLLTAVAERGLRGVVALGGDVHAHFVANLKADFDDPRSPTVASEFCGTSISSNGQPQAQTNAMLPHNPHLLYGRSDQRGYVALTLNSQLLQAELMTVQQPWNPLSPVDVAARFVVDARQPGPQRA